MVCIQISSPSSWIECCAVYEKSFFIFLFSVLNSFLMCYFLKWLASTKIAHTHTTLQIFDCTNTFINLKNLEWKKCDVENKNEIVNVVEFYVS